MRTPLAGLPVFALALAHALIVTACGTPPNTEGVVKSVGPPPDALKVQVFEPPSVTFDAEHAATQLVVKFVARAGDGTPLGPDDVEVSLALDGRPLDREALASQSSKAYEVNMLYSLVLDATRSLLLTQPPGFEPMKLAAQNSVRAAQDLWTSRRGKFGWGVLWFDDYVFRPEIAWPVEAITQIPKPDDTINFTRLYAAVDYALSDLGRLATEVGMPANHHPVLVVFSDGRDNHSAFNPPPTDEQRNLGGALPYRKVAWPSIELNVLADKVRQSSVTLHTIGVGPDVDDEALGVLAQAGHGIYAKQRGTEEVDALFKRVNQEFTTIHTVGALIPDPAGDHAFSVVVRLKGRPGQATLRYSVHVGDAEAKLLP